MQTRGFVLPKGKVYRIVVVAQICDSRQRVGKDYIQSWLRGSKMLYSKIQTVKFSRGTDNCAGNKEVISALSYWHIHTAKTVEQNEQRVVQWMREEGWGSDQ